MTYDVDGRRQAVGREHIAVRVDSQIAKPVPFWLVGQHVSFYELAGLQIKFQDGGGVLLVLLEVDHLRKRRRGSPQQPPLRVDLHAEDAP